MSQTIVPNASEVPGPDVEITPLPGYPEPLVAIRLFGHHDRLANVSRADFLAAVETECGVRCVPADAIVIERAELPEVSARVGYPGLVYITGGLYSLAITDAHSRALEYLALAEYLDAHPPVPPGQVTKLLTADEIAHRPPPARHRSSERDEVMAWLEAHPRWCDLIGAIVLTGGLWATVLLGTEGA